VGIGEIRGRARRVGGTSARSATLVFRTRQAGAQTLETKSWESYARKWTAT